MKKITDFIIDKRYIILVIFIILSIASFFVSKKVKIVYDLAEYLPDTSETRIGLDIMDEEFGELESSSFNIMFEGLDEQKKNEIYDWLSNVEEIESVDYDSSEKYNKDNYTLYTINIDDTEDSEKAATAFEKVTKNYKSYDFETSGTVSDRNKPVLPMWIIVLAVVCALIILIIMCESYVEPFLFLISILMAVLLNKGTNLIFGSVSNITNSIAAILQLALSMDYSIMLMSRYNQEKENEPDNKKAMKTALYHSFSSISSSSVTTIMGMIALVFMSFTIGRDLGLVLAKGVLFSLISIFFVLPALILIFDKWIVKTKKKTPHIKIDWLGKFSYVFRRFAFVVFILIFLLSMRLKGDLRTLYTASEDNKIAQIFGENNQIAVIYNNEDEEKVRKYFEELEGNEKVDEVLAYGNTIDQELTYDKLVEKMKDLGSDVELDDYILKILYYHYYNKAETNKMTFDEFVDFIETTVYNEPDINKEVDAETRKNIDRINNFTSREEMNKPRSSSEIADILEIDESDVEDIFTYYNSKNTNIRLSINEFIDFMNNDILTNEKYAKDINEQTRNDLDRLSKFTSLDTITTKMNYEQMASLFDMDEDTARDLYKYYISLGNIDARMTIAEFSDFVLDDVLNSEYRDQFDEKTISDIRQLNTFSNVETITTEMNAKSLATLFGIDEETVTKLLYFKYSTMETGDAKSIVELIKQVINIKQNTDYLDGIDVSILEQLSNFNKEDINLTKLNKEQLATMFNGVHSKLVEKFYELKEWADTQEMTPREFIHSVIEKVQENVEEEIEQLSLDEENIEKLKLLKTVIDASVSENPPEYTATELSEKLRINPSRMYQLYALIDMVNGDTDDWKASPYDFVAIILNNSTNPQVAEKMNAATLDKLNQVNDIMNSAIQGLDYNYSELAEFIGSDEEKIKSIYTLYMTQNVNIKLTPHEFVNFILNHRNDNVLRDNLSSSTIRDLQKVEAVMTGIENGEKYTSSELANLLGIDQEKLELLYGLYVTKYIQPNQTMSLREFVGFLVNDVMENPEYSDSFNADQKEKLRTILAVMNSVLNGTKYTKEEIFSILGVFSDTLDKKLIDLLFIYFGSQEEYNENWTMTLEKFVNFLNDDILQDNRFDEFIDEEKRKDIEDSKKTIQDAKELLVGPNYSRIVLNTSYDAESDETFEFIQHLKDLFGQDMDDFYIIGNSPMAYEMSQTFDDELNFITVITMIFIFIVVAVTFKSIILPLILVLTIQCAVYLTMGILLLSGGTAHYISLLIVQSILMGATIDYAILYSSYYLESRKTMNVKEAIINSYNKSIHTILTSASILILVTLIVGYFSSAITAKICMTISKGTLCSTLIILFILPAVIAGFDKILTRKKGTLLKKLKKDKSSQEK